MNRGTPLFDTYPTPLASSSNAGTKKMISARPIALSADSRRMRALAWIFAAAVLSAGAGTADAATRAGIVRAGAYDGVWNVVFATRAGNCSATNSAPFAVSGRRVSSAGGGKVRGGISRGGAVSVRISVGLSVASGSGRLVGHSGERRLSQEPGPPDGLTSRFHSD